MLTEPDGGYDRAFSGSLQYRRSLRLGPEQSKEKHARLVGSQGPPAIAFSQECRIRYGSLRQMALGERHDSGCSFPELHGYDDYGAFNCSGPQMYVHDDVKSAIPSSSAVKRRGSLFSLTFGFTNRTLLSTSIPSCKSDLPNLARKMQFMLRHSFMQTLE